MKIISKLLNHALWRKLVNLCVTSTKCNWRMWDTGEEIEKEKQTNGVINWSKRKRETRNKRRKLTGRNVFQEDCYSSIHFYNFRHIEGSIMLLFSGLNFLPVSKSFDLSVSESLDLSVSESFDLRKFRSLEVSETFNFFKFHKASITLSLTECRSPDVSESFDRSSFQRVSIAWNSREFRLLKVSGKFDWSKA